MTELECFPESRKKQEDANETLPRLTQKVRYLERLRAGGFNVPDFIHVPAEDFQNENFEALKAFLGRHEGSYKVLARSAHPQEEFFKGGTFDSLETYADVSGIIFARNHIIKQAHSARALSILRQQKFNKAPEIDLDEMGVIVMPFIEGTNIMAKIIGQSWEFGYSRIRARKVDSEPYITTTPHDRKLLELSKDIQKSLGFRCEIEYVFSSEGEAFVVQAKNISNVETLEEKESKRSVTLDGVRRMRRRRSYRERPVYVMDSGAFYMSVIDTCEDFTAGCGDPAPSFEDILTMVSNYETEMQEFALRCERFAVLGLSIQVPLELYQIANHYLDETPDLQKQLSKALHDNLYRRDYFLAEADTLISKDRIRVTLNSHDAYGIDTVRNPLWSAYWQIERHDEVVREFTRLGFRTGDEIGIEIDQKEIPTVYRL